MLTTYNPIMALGLLIQFLSQIKYRKHFSSFADFNVLDLECKIYRRQLETLGKTIIQYIQFDQIEDIFMEKDFLDRPVLTIVTDNDIKPFIVMSKLKFLLDKIWEGKEFSMIDGKISHLIPP